LPEIFGNQAAVSSSSKYEINEMEDFNSLKTEQVHVVCYLTMIPGSLEESPPSIKKLSQVKYSKQKFMKTEGAMRRKIFSLKHCNDSDSSGEVEMIAQLKEKFNKAEKK
jgi:hypothetical protein